MSLKDALVELWNLDQPALEHECRLRGIQLPTRRASRGLLLMRQLLLGWHYPHAVVWIRVCFEANRDLLGSMCDFLSLMPTAKVKRGLRKHPGRMQRALLNYALSPAPPRQGVVYAEASEEGRGTQNAAMVAEDPEPVDINIGVVGMWWKRESKELHPDEVRMNSLQQVLASGVRAVAITMEEKVKSDPHQAVLDIRSARGWRSRVEGVDTIENREIFLLIVDYFFVPKEYYGRSKAGLGYGLDWVVKLTTFFAWGGGMALMPNDKHGSLRRDLQDPEWCMKLTEEDATRVHPLFIATAAVTAPCGRLIGVNDKNHKDRGANSEAIKQWLDKKHPFLLCYNSQYFDGQSALAWLRGVVR
jgi:hypothetical protein